MTTNVNFDELATRAFEPTATSSDYENLFAAVFSLPEWHFIAGGAFPNVAPYCALYPDIFGDVPAVAVFTDAARAEKYLAERDLKSGAANKPVVLNAGDAQVEFSAENLILSVPTGNILDYIENLIPQGIVKIFFNPNTASQGFHHDLKMMRPIYEHLESRNMLSRKAPETIPPPAEKTFEKTENDVDFDALSRRANAPNAPMDDLNALFGAAFTLAEWQFIARGETPNVYPYVASNAGVADNRPMIRAFTDGQRLMRFARENNLTDAEGSCLTLTIPTGGIVEYLESFIPQGAYGVWFNSDTQSDGFFIPVKQLRPIREHLTKLNLLPPAVADARGRQDNLANWGISETPDGDFDLNLSVNRVGAVDFAASIAPFYETIVPLLGNYKGTGEYVSLLRFEPDGMSDLGESTVENAHGAYLQLRRFQYLNPKNNTRIGVTSIHSNRLRHVRSNAELTASFELCHNLDNRTAALYFRFEGPKSDVLGLTAAIEPALRHSGFEEVSG